MQREAAKAALQGRTTRQAGRDKDLCALNWIYRWGWSTLGIVDLIASPGRRGVAARLVKRGWLSSHPTTAGVGIKGVPLEVVVLTQDGVSEVESDLSESDLIPYSSKPELTIPWHQLRHDCLVQLWTARRLAAKKIKSFSTPREISSQSLSGIKQPDAIWTISANAKNMSIAVELELTAKKDRELDQTILALLKAVQPEIGSALPGPYDAVVLLSHSQAILDRYRRVLSSGAPLTIYERDSSRHWKASGTTKVPDWTKGRFFFEKVDLW